jgi:light-regulated signal transduction histidine kinase (bacteriophytochrome)
MVGTAVIVTLILILTGFLDVFVFGAAITNSITKPIIKLKDAMTEIGRGDFDTQIDIESKDEIGQLAACFNKMTEDLKGTTTSIAKLNEEITMRKETQEALKKTQNELEERVEQRTAELAQANKDLESAVWELRRANKELKEFAYVAAHDLKTPLRGIGTLVDWISKDYVDKFDEQGKEQVKLLVGKTKQMSALIDDILQYSRLGHSKPERQQLDLNEVLPEVITAINPPDNIEITIENELPVLMFEKTQIIQVFQNLLSNAVKYMDKPNGHIKIGCVAQGGFLKFSVADNGPGIDKKYHKKIFKLFQTLSSQQDRDDSTGIGLSIVNKIVELNAGVVWLESELGKGSTFFFTLPKSVICQQVPAVSAAEQA